MTTQRRKSLLVACAFFVAIALPTLAHAQKTVPLVILGGTLIDATGRPPLENAVIVVEGERIKAVGKRGEVTVPARRADHRR